MFKKLIYLSLLWIVVISYSVLTGCCEEVVNVCFTSDQLELVAYNNSDSLAVKANEDFVLGKALMLRMSFSGYTRLCIRPRSVPFINSAYATSCSETYVYKHLDTIMSIAVYADKDYDAQHPAGTALNDLFYIPKLDVLNYRDQYHYSYDLYALQSPEQTGEYTYTVKLVLADGRTVEAISKPVYIVP